MPITDTTLNERGLRPEDADNPNLRVGPLPRDPYSDAYAWLWHRGTAQSFLARWAGFDGEAGGYWLFFGNDKMFAPRELRKYDLLEEIESPSP